MLNNNQALLNQYQAAIDVTAGMYLDYIGDTQSLIDAQYRDIHRNPTEGTTAPHLSVFDPAGIHHTQVRLPPTGLPTVNANHWANGQNHGGTLPEWNYLQILTHYYTGIVIRNGFEQALAPAYRWNPLIPDWGGGSPSPPSMQYGGNSTYNVIVTLQNTGYFPWTHPSEGSTSGWFLSYRWRKDSNLKEASESVEIGQSGQPLTVAVGEHRQVTLTVHDPPN